MKNLYFTKNNSHPEDLIYKTKKFINELQTVQDYYFNNLVKDINLNKEYEDYLFDFIFNSQEDNYDGFDHYLEEMNVSLQNEDNPMLHMSSYEADLETSYPSLFENFSSGELNTIHNKSDVLL